MTLAPGTRLGPYKVAASIGRGGMGEVYRAIDTRLDRTVAIKVMAGAFTGFDGSHTLEIEARASATLNHPHICALHDVSRDGDTPFLVMEYVKGETLASRLARGPLPVREAIRFAIQIAEALDHAHRHGVVHRDLKPSNIMITQSGVKVLDFGLASLRAAAPLQLPLDVTPSASQQLASERTLLGTVHYMAPERLEGREADAASDLFSLGAVMYEMITGRRPFESSSPAGVIAAILRSDPPAPSSVQPDVPASLDWIVQKALAKNPDARWRAAGDVVEVLRWIARQPANAGAATDVRPQQRLLVPLSIASVLIAAGLGLALARTRPAETPALPPMTFSIFPPENGGFTPTPSSVPAVQFALSPNGRRLAFIASVGHDPSQIWIRALDSLTAEPLAGTQGAEYPFWSPDSESLGFFADGVLKRIDLAGGPARTLAAAPNGRGGAWSRSGIILFAPGTQGGIYRVRAGGGELEPVTRVDTARREASHRWPQFLPDDRHFIYFVQSASPDAHGIYLDAIERSAPRRLLSSGLNATYVPPDRLLFVVEDALMAARFDWQNGRVDAESLPVISSIAGSSNFYAAVSASHTGVLAYESGASSSELVWMDRGGRRIGSLGAPAEYADFRLSPRGDRLAVALVDAQGHRPDIRMFDLARGAKARLTSDPATDASPVWSPDGQRIVFRSNPNGLHDLYQQTANGAGPSALLLQSPNAKYPTDWTPDGRNIVFHTSQTQTGFDIWMASVDGLRSTPLVQTPFDEVQGQVSRLGQWLAYTSLETGQPEVYVRGLSDAATRWQVSGGGGSDPRWRGDGRELFYVSADSWLTSVTFTDSGPAVPRRLFRVHVAPLGNPFLSNYDVTSDGQRFLVKVPVRDVMSAPIQILTSWLNAKHTN
jgi:serine/threonine protein kinase